MIVWYNKKRWAVNDDELNTGGPADLMHLVSCDDTVAQYKTVAKRKLEGDPAPDYWEAREASLNKLGLQPESNGPM